MYNNDVKRMVIQLKEDIVKKKKEKTEKPGYNMWQCSGYMIKTAWEEKEKKVLVLCFLTSFFAVANSLIGLFVSPALLGQVERGVPLHELIFTAAAFTLALMLCSAASSYIGTNIMYGKISVRLAIIGRLNKKCCVTSYPNLEDEKFIKMQSKAEQSCNSNSAATESVWNTLTGLLTNTAGFVIYLLMLTTVDPLLILIITATTAVGYFVNKQLSSYGYRHREELGELENRLAYCVDTAGESKFAKDIRIFNMKPWLDEIRDKAMAAYRAFHVRASNVYIWGRIVDVALSFLRNGIAYVYLIDMVLNDGLSVSEFLLYFSAVGGFTTWISGILGSFTTLYRQSLELSTIREFLEYPEQFHFADGEPLTPDKSNQYEIKLDDVSFKYPGAENYTLEHISLTIHPGEKIAVVGLNGAGKTTLVNLICGFYDPTEGRVLLNGVDIRKYNRQDYYKMFSAVFQKFQLIASSVAANVAQSEDEIDMERVKSCVEKAGLTEKIESLPEGYDSKLNRTVYEDATNLSGGETQRLMLARALYKNAPIVILDEPTAALDPIAEADMYGKYNEMTDGCSSVYISHRLASTRFCDRILFIEGHGIAEEGTHEELLRRGGRYAELFEVQSKYYREGEDFKNE